MTVLVLGDAHAGEPENREALLAAYEAATSDTDVTTDPDAATATATDANTGAGSGASAALQVGDLGFYDPPIPTWFVAGNNEDLDVIDALRAGVRSGVDQDGSRAVGERDRPAVGDDLHLLASTAAEVAGLRVAGLSGNFAPTQYGKPRSELSGERRRHFVREDVERAMELGDVDVLLVHEAPHGLLPFGYDPGCEHVDALVEALEPDLCLVGHFHRHVETDRGGTRVVCLAPAWERYYTLDPASLALESHETPAPAE